MHTIPIVYRGILYEATLNKRRILRVRKVMEDSGIERDVQWDSLPEYVKEEIEKELKK